jgi:RNA polymerase sigma-70 factor (ECF subfamily)
MHDDARAPTLVSAHDLRDARSGEPAARDRFARGVWPHLRRIALAITGDPGLADDVAQDAMMKVLRALPRFDATRPLGPWVRTIARNTARNAQRGERTRTAFDPDPLGEAAIESPRTDSVERALDLDGAARTALDAFTLLSARQREILELVDHQGLSPSEAARELDLAPGTVRATLHTARRTLRRALLADRPELLDLLRS